MTKLCLRCQGLYVQETVECPWCESTNLVPMSEEEYAKTVLDVDAENETEYPEPIDYMPIGSYESPYSEGYFIFTSESGDTFEFKPEELDGSEEWD